MRIAVLIGTHLAGELDLGNGPVRPSRHRSAELRTRA